MSQPAMPAIGMTPIFALLKPAPQAGSVTPLSPVLREPSQYLSDFADIFDSVLGEEMIGHVDPPAPQAEPEVEIAAQIAQDAGLERPSVQAPEEMDTPLPGIVDLESVASPAQVIVLAKQAVVDHAFVSMAPPGQQAMGSPVFSATAEEEPLRSDNRWQLPLTPESAMEAAETAPKGWAPVTLPEKGVTVQTPLQNVGIAENRESSSLHASPHAVSSDSSDPKQPVRNGFDAGQQIQAEFRDQSREVTEVKPARNMEGNLSPLQPMSLDAQPPRSSIPEVESVRKTLPGSASAIPQTVSVSQSRPATEPELSAEIVTDRVQRPASGNTSGTQNIEQSVPRSQERPTTDDQSVQLKERPHPTVSTVPPKLNGIDERFEVLSAPVPAPAAPEGASRRTLGQLVQSTDPRMQSVDDQPLGFTVPVRNGSEDRPLPLRDHVPPLRLEGRVASEPVLPSTSGVGSLNILPPSPLFNVVHDVGRSDPMVADVSEAMGLQITTSSSVPPTGEVIQARSDTQRPVLQQFLDASVRAFERPVDLHLNPEELGRVRISMVMNDGVITMTVVAERSETLDLLRRHSEQLAQELRQIGYGTINFSFGQNDGGRDGRQETPQFEQSPELAASPPTTQPRDRPTGHQSGLDIRV